MWWGNLILVLAATVKGPGASSRHPANGRPRRSRGRRCQRTATTPDFPHGTGVQQGFQRFMGHHPHLSASAVRR
jgi:hypothetical protein